MKYKHISISYRGFFFIKKHVEICALNLFYLDSHTNSPSPMGDTLHYCLIKMWCYKTIPGWVTL